jgi:choline dehydrogenase-like flavoprotein
MDGQATEHADVVVVGAGPTGVLLAGDLIEAGVRVVLLERRAGQSNLARAFAVPRAAERGVRGEQGVRAGAEPIVAP